MIDAQGVAEVAGIAWKPSPVLGPVANYYADKLLRHGPTPAGVDWACQPTQALRFVQLLKVVEGDDAFSLNDIGCGYGALRGFIDWRLGGRQVDYCGADISDGMVKAARSMWAGRADCTFVHGECGGRVADYCMASGIFNVKLNAPEKPWIRSIREVLARMHEECRIGLAVNFLESAYEGPIQRPELYATAPQPWAQWLRRRFGLKVRVVRGYGLREFTLLARRPRH